ncbi:hypothetical protein GUJ93_ZPchr0628g40555 [Zizania palustris]|uniref:Uncharacterized protein n=1 Tax=Zizania palustris TaxID=103762 RepID=A0A8J5VRH5_ZIZPA|nr:hypothetical protein GUJ93_ZPchr0628g40555 [Zizania palustris]
MHHHHPHRATTARRVPPSSLTQRTVAIIRRVTLPASGFRTETNSAGARPPRQPAAEIPGKRQRRRTPGAPAPRRAGRHASLSPRLHGPWLKQLSRSSRAPPCGDGRRGAPAFSIRYWMLCCAAAACWAPALRGRALVAL